MNPVTARWVLAVPGHLEVQSGEVPAPGPDQVLLRSTLVGICGSDLHAAAGHHPFVPLPYRPGHETIGVVEALPDGVAALPSAGARAGFGPAVIRPGDRVVVEPDLYCGHCKQCGRGLTNLCENMDFFGCGNVQGGMAERSVVRADRLHVVPDDLSDEQASLIEPIATPVQAVRVAAEARAGERPDLTGRAVVVLGAGTIGLLVVAAARYFGAARIVVTDPLAAKRERAVRWGADAAVDGSAPDAVAQVRAALGESADVVFDCVAVQATTDQAVALANKGGTVVVVGVPVAPVTVPLPLIQDSRIRIQGTITYRGEDYREAMRMLAEGVVRPDDLITLVAPLDEVNEAFAAARSGEHGKVLIRP